MLSSQISSNVMFPVVFPVPRGFPASGDSQIPGAAQLPMGIQLLDLSKSPGMFSFLLGSAAPRASQLLRILHILRNSQLPEPSGAPQLQIPGHAQLPEGPNSAKIPVELQPSWNPQQLGGSGSSALALPGFLSFLQLLLQ